MNGRSPRFPLVHTQLHHPAPDAGAAGEKSQALANYLSIGDRYSTLTNFDSENTIGRRFGVNRARSRSAAFLPAVVKRQQWQIGDSLLNSKFGGPARHARKPPTTWGFRLALRYLLWDAPRKPDLISPVASGTARISPVNRRSLRIALVDPPMRFC